MCLRVFSCCVYCVYVCSMCLLRVYDDASVLRMMLVRFVYEFRICVVCVCVESSSIVCVFYVRMHVYAFVCVLVRCV